MSEDRSAPPGPTRPIPDRRYFRIREAAELVGVRPHVLRYWEAEFPEVRPPKGRGGQRLYRRRDVALLRAIRRLVHEERYTLAGARDRLRELVAGDRLDRFVEPGPASSPAPERLNALREGLRDLLLLLERRERDLSERPGIDTPGERG